jgi:hypothetical protein
MTKGRRAGGRLIDNRNLSGQVGASVKQTRECPSGMRRSTLLEFSGVEFHEVAHVRRCFAGELV